MRPGRLRLPAVILAFALGGAAPAAAWHDEGHYYIARAAVDALPEDVPAFFREGRDAIAHGSLDPDARQIRSLPQLRDAEKPEHFLDSELLQGRPWPETRYAYLRLCVELGIDPGVVGTLPYAIAERAQQLAAAFAEHRRWPENPHIRAKCLVIAGELSHFTGDLHQPLHTTLHYDGHVTMPGTLPRPTPPGGGRGIHARVDALPTKVPFAEIFPEPVAAPEPPGADGLMAYIAAEFAASHAHLDAVYDAAHAVPPVRTLDLPDERVRAMTIERTRAGARFTAGVFLYAWRVSESVALPSWLDRATFDDAFDPSRVPPQPAP